jgi:hypothetical protein
MNNFTRENIMLKRIQSIVNENLLNPENNIFVYGMSGSGKDTISNYLVENYGYMKLRIARTIKQIVCEKHNLTFDELEIQKRINPELRKAHHIVSSYLGKEATFNRIKQLLDNTAFDFDYMTKEDLKFIPKVICDVRQLKEAEICLQAGWTGIFLSRTTNEFKVSSHYTEQNMFLNGELERLNSSSSYKKQLKIIYNNDDYERQIPFTTTFTTNGSVSKLEQVIDKIISNFKWE